MRIKRVTIWMLLALTCVAAALCYEIVFHILKVNGRSFIDNYFPFWSWSRFVHETDIPARIYQFPVLDAFQRSLDPDYIERLPFAYPPTFLLVIWPLGLLPRFVAYSAFLGGGLALYVAACWHRPWGRRIACLALIAPSTVLSIFNAQNSLLIAALMIGGCRLINRRPILAGVLFGLVSFKPQFGMLLPVALASAREWRAFVAAAATALAGVVASGIAFGWTTWAAFPEAMVYLARFVAPVARANEFSPTVAATLRLLGASPTVTHVGQLVGALLVAGMTFSCFRRGFRPLPVAALLVGTFFTTPYAFYYDLPIATYAVLLVWMDARSARTGLRGAEIAVLALAIGLPYLMYFAAFGLPYAGIVLVLLLGLIVRRMIVAEHRPELVAAVAPNTAFG